MKVIDFGPDSNTIYRYRVEIPKENKNSVDDFLHWLSENKITAGWRPSFVFFHHERDVVLFMLRWA
jgi:hypothetical protein